MKRFATLILLAAGIGAASAVAAAHAGSPASSTSTGASTAATTTSTTSTTSSTSTVPVVNKFPAAGTLNENLNSVVVRRQPDPHAAKVKVLHYFMPDYYTQEIFATGVTTGSDGQPWYHIEVPGRPNGQTGWIPAATATGLAPTPSLIVVHVRARRIDVYRRGKHVLHAIVAVGAPGMETPLGHYYVQVRYAPTGDPFLGVWALETSAYSKLSDWPGGGIVGIHGTNEPWLLGKAVSHGCVRVSNATASALKRLAPLGTPITIKA